MAESKPHTQSMVWMSGSYQAKDILLKRAIVREGLSRLTETTVEFQSKNKAVKLDKIVGRTMNLHLILQDGTERRFAGLCVSVENLGFRDGYGHYVAEVRPWAWLLTRTRDCRIFQEKTAVDIIKQVFNDHGFSHFTDKLSDSYDTREYCVQYRETDYDFVSRLMEEEGIYFYFDSDKDKNAPEKLVLCDGISGHAPVKGDSTLTYHARDNTDRRREDHIAELSIGEHLTHGKVTLNDYDYLSPTAEPMTANTIKKGSHSHTEMEVYDYPGHYRKNTQLGNKRARVRMEAEAIRHKRWRGAGSVRTLGTGYTFKLKNHPDRAANAEYLIIDAVHYLQVSTDFAETEMRHDLQPMNVDFPEEMKGDTYACVFGAISKQDQYRAWPATSWPGIPGLHTATVVGKKGEEIWTDADGRIKVQFHWDREGKKDENSSCWVRVVTPWSGKGWGMVAVPRMGQEVVIQFEEGDPDRPICTGMLYNKDTMPPFEYPGDQTQLGIRTNSSKGGGGYNELMFEDKAGEELMRVQAQKDHQTLVKNKSVKTIGYDDVDVGDHDEDGCESKVVRKHITEKVKEGDHYFTIESGSQEIEIETDKTQTIRGKHVKTITGNDETTITQGNMTVAVSSGKIEVEAMQSIELKVGGSSIKLEPAQITIKSVMVKVEGSAMVDVKGGLTNLKADGIMTINGSMTKIN